MRKYRDKNPYFTRITAFIYSYVSFRTAIACCQQTSPHYLELLSDIKLKLLSELKLATEEEHIYTKVIQQSNLDEHLFLLQFTVFLPKAMVILNALCQAG
ncbi:hypothetical protein [uncultured Nostoc sp.]|uniref:hypothetical protein n=1 Tax=uncultured Nostoc sp. TaxID=340711 RepID=UPI0035CBA3A6